VSKTVLSTTTIFESLVIKFFFYPKFSVVIELRTTKIYVGITGFIDHLLQIMESYVKNTDYGATEKETLIYLTNFHLLIVNRQRGISR
jgi:hypothetical protein